MQLFDKELFYNALININYIQIANEKILLTPSKFKGMI